jgi:signal peptidase II
MSPGRNLALGLASALAVLAADQGSKWWVMNELQLPVAGNIDLLPVLSLRFVANRGITFGLLNGVGAGASWILAAGALAIVGALFIWLSRAQSNLVVISLGAISGGAIGNVIDRLRFGWVVDFIHAHAFGWSWYVFNVADAAIVCGVAALILNNLFSKARGDRLAGIGGGG